MIEVWDKDTVTTDDYIGGATFTLKELSTGYLNASSLAKPADPLRMPLIDKKGKGGRCLRYIIIIFFFKNVNLWALEDIVSKMYRRESILALLKS